MSDVPSAELIYAVRKGNLNRLEALLDSYGLSYTTTQGYCLLREALMHKREEIAKFLLYRGATVNDNGQQIETPLHLAVRNSYAEVVEMLVDRDAKVDAEDRCGETPFHVAIVENNCKIFNILRKRNIDVGAISNRGLTLLHFAASMGRTSLIKMLLKHGVEVNCAGTGCPSEGHTPLHIAAARGEKTILELLIRNGANVNAIGTHSGTPLHWAVYMNRRNVIAALMKHGANIDMPDNRGKTSLGIAIESGDFRLVEQVLKYHPDPNNTENRRSFYAAIQDSSSRTHKQGESYCKIIVALTRFGFGVIHEDTKNVLLLEAAVEKGLVTIVEDLLKLGANVNTRNEIGVTLLHRAAKYKKLEMAKLLIENKANINAVDCCGKTPLHNAVESRDEEITRLLLSKRPNLSKTNILHTAINTLCKNIVVMLLEHDPTLNLLATETDDTTPLYSTIAAPDIVFTMDEYSIVPKADNTDENKHDIVKILLNRGADVNARTATGTTALHVAAQKGYSKVVELLLKHNAAVNYVSKDQLMTALHSAARSGNIQIVKMLIAKGVAINATNIDGDNAIMIATKFGYLKIVKLLLKNGADVTSRDVDGATLLHLAVVSKNLDTVKLLLNIVEDVDCIDKKGWTPLHTAAKLGYRAIIKHLLDRGSDLNIVCKDCNTPFDYAIINFNIFDNYFRHDMHEDLYDESPEEDTMDFHDYADFYIESYYNDFRDEFHEVCKVFEHHIWMKISLGHYVNNQNLKGCRVVPGELSNQLDELKNEIEAMKRMKIGDSIVTYYDILTKGINQLAIYARNNTIVGAMKMKFLRNNFKFYCGMIDSRFKEGEKRYRLLDPSFTSLNILIGNTMPDLVFTELSKYLSGKDLKNIIKANNTFES